jgi:hypothetical protein
VSGCGGSDGGGGGGTAPIITGVTLTDENFNPKLLFNIGDLGNFLCYASDPDLDIDTLFVTQFYPSNSLTPTIGPNVISLPSQSSVDMVYFLIQPEVITGPAGDWRIEFLIEDDKGHDSNTFVVYYVVQ